jgi:predicted RNase H-like HicB family nuclease
MAVVLKIVVWKEDDAWLGYFQDYPDYWARGESEEDLREELKDLYHDLTSGAVPGIKKIEELVIG